MLSTIQQHAVVCCLAGIDEHAHRTFSWPGPILLAVLREAPVAGHPDPTARHLGVAPVPIPPRTWQHPDGPLAALQQIGADLHHPVIQAALATATSQVRLLAWVFMHADMVVDEDLGPVRVRYVDSVDLDGRSYLLTHLPGHATALIAVNDGADTGDTTGAITVLRALARTIRTH